MKSAQPATLLGTWKKYFYLYPVGTCLIFNLCLLLPVCPPCTTEKILAYLHWDLPDDLLLYAGELPLGPPEATSPGSGNPISPAFANEGSAPAPSAVCQPSVENSLHFTKACLALGGSKLDALFSCALMSAEFRWMAPSLGLWADRLLIQPWGAVDFPCPVHCLPPRLGYFCRLMQHTGSQIPACITAGGHSFPAAALGICLLSFVWFLLSCSSSLSGSLWMAACLLLCQMCSLKSSVICKLDGITVHCLLQIIDNDIKHDPSPCLSIQTVLS